MPDHAHLLIDLPPTMALATAVNLLKSNSSKWLREEHSRPFRWQEGYGAFGVSASNVNAVADYVRDQSKHHARRSFDQELMALLRKHGLEFDPRHVLG